MTLEKAPISFENAYRERRLNNYCIGLYGVFFASFSNNGNRDPGQVVGAFRSLYHMVRAMSGPLTEVQQKNADSLYTQLSTMGEDVSFKGIMSGLSRERQKSSHYSPLSKPERNKNLRIVSLEDMEESALWLGTMRLVYEKIDSLVVPGNKDNYYLFKLIDCLITSYGYSQARIASLSEKIIRQAEQRGVAIGINDIKEAAGREIKDLDDLIQ